MDTAHARAKGFRVSPDDSRFTSPMGPVLLVSPASGDRLRWRFRVSGNSSWSVGVVADSGADDRALFERGKLGLDSTGLAGGAMARANMHGEWVRAEYDASDDRATFCFRDETVVQQGGGELRPPARLALSTFNGTEVEFAESFEE